MIIAITGHTTGIGKACADLLSTAGHSIIGLSRSNGYDVNDTSKVIDAVKSADVFINNAHSGYQQTILLNAVFEAWRDQSKIIVNVGSVVTHYPRIEQSLDHLPWDYRDQKVALENAFRRIVKMHKECRLHIINPGATDTPLIKHHSCVKLTPQYVAKYIQDMINDPHLLEMTLYAR